MVVIDLRSPTSKFIDRQREFNKLQILEVSRTKESNTRQIQILKNENKNVQAGITTQAPLQHHEGSTDSGTVMGS